MQQLWTVLGPEGSKFVIWIGVGLALMIGVAILIWLLLRVFGRNLNMSSAGGRGQPQRLAITGAFNVDRKGRKLVIVRRDNVEHLILIGGPNDVLVEAGIIRAERSARPANARDDAAEAPVQPVMAPAAPQVTTAPPVIAPKPAAPPVIAPPSLPPVIATPPRRPEPDLPPIVAAPPVMPPRIEQPSRVEPVVAAKPSEFKPLEIRPIDNTSEPAPVIAPMPDIPAAEPTAPAMPKPVSDPRLSDMARRLQSVLQRPLTPAVKPTATPAVPVAPLAPVVKTGDDAAEMIPIPLPSSRKPDAPAAPEPKAETAEKPKSSRPAAPVTQGNALSSPEEKIDPASIDSLEEEMARLLGRTGPDKT